MSVIDKFLNVVQFKNIPSSEAILHKSQVFLQNLSTPLCDEQRCFQFLQCSLYGGSLLSEQVLEIRFREPMFLIEIYLNEY